MLTLLYQDEEQQFLPLCFRCARVGHKTKECRDPLVDSTNEEAQYSTDGIVSAAERLAAELDKYAKLKDPKAE